MTFLKKVKTSKDQACKGIYHSSHSPDRPIVPLFGKFLCAQLMVRNFKKIYIPSF